jgi:protein-S-isoprenylcysteine O-methyltransferase Ste14
MMRRPLLPPAWFVALNALMLLLHFALPIAQWNVGMARWWGIPFTVAGAAMLAAALRRFARRTTLHPFERPARLVTDGVFRVSRNPMYTGMLLSLVGVAIMLGSLSPLVAIPIYVAVIRARFIDHEERVLEQCFDADYQRYRGRVRRWL